LGDPDYEVRAASARALGQIGDPLAIEPLAVALVDPQSSVRQAAAAALRKVDLHWEKSEAAQRALPRLRIALQDKEYWVRQSAADVLAKIGQIRASEPEVDAFSTPIQLRHQIAVETLLEALEDGDRDLRLAAAEALARIRDKRALEPLVGRLNDPDPWVQMAVERSLRSLGWKHAGESPAASASEAAPRGACAAS
jgi:HEAT repeat protein